MPDLFKGIGRGFKAGVEAAKHDAHAATQVATKPQKHTATRWLKLGQDGSVHEIVLNDNGRLTEFPAWEPSNSWSGNWSLEDGGHKLVLIVGEYQVVVHLHKDDRGYFAGRGTHQGKPYAEYKMVVLAL